MQMARRRIEVPVWHVVERIRQGERVSVVTRGGHQITHVMWMDPNGRMEKSKLCREQVWVSENMILAATCSEELVIIYTFRDPPEQRLQIIMQRFSDGGYGAPSTNFSGALRNVLLYAAIEKNVRDKLSGLTISGIGTKAMDYIQRCLHSEGFGDERVTISQTPLAESLQTFPFAIPTKRERDRLTEEAEAYKLQQNARRRRDRANSLAMTSLSTEAMTLSEGEEDDDVIVASRLGESSSQAITPYTVGLDAAESKRAKNTPELDTPAGIKVQVAYLPQAPELHGHGMADPQTPFSMLNSINIQPPSRGPSPPTS